MTNILSIGAGLAISGFTLNYTNSFIENNPLVSVIYEDPKPSHQGTNGEVQLTLNIIKEPCFAAVYPACEGHVKKLTNTWYWHSVPKDWLQFKPKEFDVGGVLFWIGGDGMWRFKMPGGKVHLITEHAIIQQE